MQAKTLFVVIGPTAVGKTDVSIALAQALGAPILNADSRQLFRDLSIGTAAPSPEQLAAVKHYFVGILGLADYYSAARFEHDALTLLSRLFAQGDVAILSGGSMLYTDAVCRGIDDIPTIDEATRQTVRRRLEAEGLEALCHTLQQLDPDYYALVDHHNTRRVVHALEICLMTGRTYTSFRIRRPQPRPFNIVKIGLRRPRAELFERIGRRVDHMMGDGLLSEAHHFYPQRHLNSLNTVGYKELFLYFDGRYTLDEAVEKIKRNTRVYAKKQMTWYRKDTDIAWFHPDQINEIIKFARQKLCEVADLCTFVPTITSAP